MIHDADAAGGLAPRQAATMTGLAVGLWLSGVVFIRIAVPLGLFSGGIGTVLLFALALPLNWLTIWLARRVAALGQGQIVAGMGLGSGVAILCDGLALAWAPGLYGGVSADLHRAAAWLLFVVGLGLVMAFFMGRRGETPSA